MRGRDQPNYAMKLPARLRPDAAVLLAPSLRAGDVEGLASADWRRVAAPGELVDLARWRDAYGAVRLSAEAGAPAASWCCALDPVRLAADMRDVRLSAWPLDTLDDEAAERLLAAAAAFIAEDSDPRLRRLALVAPSPARWYLVGEEVDALHFDADPADALVGRALRGHKPVGADGPLLQRLTTELQMLFHAEGGAASGVWPHGAGVRPDASALALPPLASDDPFWRGCWRLAAPGVPVDDLPAGAAPPPGSATAPLPADAPAALAAASRDTRLKRLHVVTHDATLSFTRGGWRSLFARWRP